MLAARTGTMKSAGLLRSDVWIGGGKAEHVADNGAGDNAMECVWWGGVGMWFWSW